MSSPIVWGPNNTAEVLPANGLVYQDRTVIAIPPVAGASIFDDMLWGLTNVNLNYGPMGFNGVSIGNGVVQGMNAGVAVPGVAGRIGLCGLQTNTTNNGTGQASLWAGQMQTYPGQASNITMQWAAQMPPSLSTAGVEYVVAMGFDSGIGQNAATPAVNSCMIMYKRTVSTNFCAQTSNNSTATSVTTADSADFAVTANAWYNFKIVMVAGLVSFYVAPAGGAYVLLGTSSTNLPDVSDQCYPIFSIYKASTTTTSRQCQMDWVKIDYTFSANR